MKKLFTLLLALAVLFTLVSCGGNSSTPTTSPAAPADSSAVSETDHPASTIDPLTFSVNTTFYETDTAGEVTQYFVDKVSELSGGAITVEVSWGGTLYDDTSAYDAVRSGAIQMIVMKETRILDYLPLIGIPSCAPANDGQGALDYMNTIYFIRPGKPPRRFPIYVRSRGSSSWRHDNGRKLLCRRFRVDDTGRIGCRLRRFRSQGNRQI